MTRINCGIKPSELSDKALIAEHREITRVPNSIKSGRAVVKDIPKTFCLGTGHVKFFYNKLLYLEIRYNSLYAECLRRGFNVTNKSDAFKDLPPALRQDYVPTDADRALLVQRLTSRGQLKS